MRGQRLNAGSMRRIGMEMGRRVCDVGPSISLVSPIPFDGYPRQTTFSITRPSAT